MEDFKNNAFVFYGSFEKAISEWSEDIQFQCYKALISYGLNGTYESDNQVVNSLMSVFIPNIDAAQNRYDKAVESGKRGGRPSSISKEEIQELKAEGKTQKQIAEMLGISERTVRRYWNGQQDKTTGQNNRTQSGQQQDTKRTTGQNYDTNNLINIEEKIGGQNLNNNINIKKNINNIVLSADNNQEIVSDTTIKENTAYRILEDGTLIEVKDTPSIKVSTYYMEDNCSADYDIDDDDDLPF